MHKGIPPPRRLFSCPAGGRPRTTKGGTHQRGQLHMSKALAGFLIAAVVAVVGCDPGKKTAGGPGATTPDGKPPMFGQADDTFHLSVGSQAVKRGDAKEVTVGIKRGTNFDQDVGLRFVDLPTGVTVTPEGPAVEHGGGDVRVTLTAADTAAP